MYRSEISRCLFIGDTKLEIHNQTNKKTLTLKTINYDLSPIESAFYTPETLKNDKLYADAYFNAPNVALFRINSDTLAITMANRFFLDSLGYSSQEELTENHIGLDDIVVIGEIPFVVEELEIFREISKFQLQAQRKNKTIFWTLFNGKASEDHQYIDCNFVSN